MGNGVKSYGLQEIADWQLKGSESVKLPPLQRGFVWEPAQIETLWDSLLRGFPIGSFLLSKNGNEDNDEKYLVLDGQQRATSIALGYYSPWTIKEKKHEFWSLKKIPVLWFDLSPQKSSEETANDRKFIARIITQSHPWGYQRADNSAILNIKDRREALEVFREIHEERNSEYKGYTQLLPENVFPYDCTLPVPFAFLIESLKQNDWKTALINMCEEMLPYKYIRTKVTKNYFEKLSKYINEDKIKSEIVKAVKNLDELKIPAIIVPGQVLQAEDTSEGENPTLFVRLNSGGTEIKGEELIYSIYKAAFPKSKDLVEKAGAGFLAPSRIINLSARLIWSKINNNEYPAAISVNQFRQRIKNRKDNKNFSAELNKFIENDGKISASVLFAKAIDILTLKNDIKTPAVLLKILLNQSQDLFLMLLRWIMLKLEKEPDFQPSIDEAKRIFGTFTALNWFCNKPEQYVREIWNSIGQKDFLTKEILREPFFKKDVYIMYPLIQPKTLREFLLKKVVTDHKNWNELYPKKDDKIFKQYEKCLPKDWESDEIRTSAILYDMWGDFIEKLAKNKSLILFAQRVYVNKNFKDYNQIENLEDTSRPWDWDHIYPESYVKGKRGVEKIRDWTKIIGNLRALALEDNRSENDNFSPSERLDDQYNKAGVLIKKGKEIRQNGFVTDDNWEDWKKIDGGIYEDDHKKRAAYLRAVINRLCDIYQEWYDTLNIGDLFNF